MSGFIQPQYCEVHIRKIKMKKEKSKNNFNVKSGYVMLLTAIIFMMVSIVIIFGLSTPIIKQIFISRDIWNAKQGYYLSEAGVEDVLYRLKDTTYTQYVGSTESISLNGYGATTTFSGSLSGVDGMTITALSDQNGYDKKIETKVKKGSGVAFIYGLQVGQGGFTMTGSSGITGSVFSAGPIIGCSSCYITGSAIVSNSPNIIADQFNDTPALPSNSVIFDDTSSTQDVAQSFKVSSTSALTQISLFIKKVGSPSSVVIKIVKNNNGSPSSNSSDVVSSATLNSAQVTTNYDWVDVSLSPNPNLVVGTTYWIVLDAPLDSTSNKYVVGASLDSNYSSGTLKIGSLGGIWNNSGYDAYFRIYLGGFFGSIQGESQWNQVNIGTTASDIVWAHNVSYVKSSGPIRCQNELYNNKACDQSYADPSPAAFPVSDGNISSWKDEATVGGIISGGYSKTDSSSVSFGPKKIIGDLHIGGSVALSMTGSLYVTGNLIIDGSGIIKLPASYGTNSGIIVVDGIVTIGGSAKVEGSGQPGSYIMIVSNSTCPTGSCSGNPAINMSGSGGAVILNAQKGTINFSGSADTNEATANMITMSGSTKITYQSGIANANFSTGPSGSFNISSWKELSN
jgi:hypothetical protein